jgi:hypothetical protein
MKLFGFKKRKTLTAHFGFAWWPMWVLDMSDNETTFGWVWLERVWLEPFKWSSNYQKFRVDKQGRPLNQKYGE